VNAVDEGSTRAILAAFLANLGIAVVKFVAFLFTGAASMLAESIHSVADTGNQALLALGGRSGRRAPTAEHPFGFGRERYFWAFLVAVVLFTLGSLFALFEGYEKLRHPREIESPAWAFGALLAALALESWSLRTAVHEAGKVRAGQSWWAFIRRSKSPELPVVLLEDVGALLGLGCALVGVSLAVVTGQSRFDAAGSIAIGLLLGVIAVTLGTEMRSLLIGEAASQAQVAAIQAALLDGPVVRRLIHLRTLQLGPDELLVGAKVEFDPALTVVEAAQAIDEAERRVRAKVPSARVIYLEPDCYRPGAKVEPASTPDP
jgi:cation diffusion facilitator family transporter